MTPAPDEVQANPRGASAELAERASILRPPAQEDVGSQSTVPPGNVEDISSAPTEILSPEKMAALHNRLWQQDQEPQAAQAGTANGTTEPTLWSGASEAQNQQSAAEHISIDTSSPLPASSTW